MKISIPKGVSVESALKHIEKLLGEQYGDYPIISTDLNIYIKLADASGLECPDNHVDFRYSDGEFFNVYSEKKRQATAELLGAWTSFHKRLGVTLDAAQKAVRVDETYFATAEEKGRKPDVLAKREKAYKRNKERYNELSKLYEVAEKLKECAMAHRCERLSINYTRVTQGSEFRYFLKATFVFTDDDGVNWYFDGESLSLKPPRIDPGY